MSFVRLLLAVVGVLVRLGLGAETVQEVQVGARHGTYRRIDASCRLTFDALPAHGLCIGRLGLSYFLLPLPLNFVQFGLFLSFFRGGQRWWRRGVDQEAQWGGIWSHSMDLRLWEWDKVGDQSVRVSGVV